MADQAQGLRDLVNLAVPSPASARPIGAVRFAVLYPDDAILEWAARCIVASLARLGVSCVHSLSGTDAFPGEQPILLALGSRRNIAAAYATLKTIARSGGGQPVHLVVVSCGSEAESEAIASRLQHVASRFLDVRVQHVGSVSPVEAARDSDQIARRLASAEGSCLLANLPECAVVTTRSQRRTTSADEP